jgi:hypothetical protein
MQLDVENVWIVCGKKNLTTHNGATKLATHPS